METKTTANSNIATLSSGGPGQARNELLQLVGFRVGAEEYALDILRVQEIIRLPHLTRVPNAPESIDGVMNLRGKIIPVVALRKRFGLDSVGAGKQTRIVVVEVRGTVLGFMVDSVSEVLRIAAHMVQPPPLLGKDKEYVSGVGKLDDRLLILLDVERLIASDSSIGAPPS